MFPMQMVVRTGSDPASLAAAVRRATYEVDPAVPVAELQPLTAMLAGTLGRPRLLAVLLSVFAAAGVLLSVVGLYGVVAVRVRQREREIGIRMALGATARTMAGQVVRQGLVQAGAGLCVGHPGGLRPCPLHGQRGVRRDDARSADLRRPAPVAHGHRGRRVLPAGAAGGARGSGRRHQVRRAVSGPWGGAEPSAELVCCRPVLARLLARVGLVTPEQRAWARYDCGNSAYFTTVVTAVFPAFFASYAAAGMPAGEATTRFGLVTTIGMAIVAVAAPILGAYGDYTARRKRLLVGCALLGIASTFALTTISEGGWRWAALVFILGNIGVSGSLVFYDSMLPSVATPVETDRVSSAGYALGYLGGGLLLVLNLAWVLQPQLFGLSGTVAAIKLSFASVGIWWLLFMIPLLRRVPEPPRAVRPGTRSGAAPCAESFARLAHTFSEIRQYPQAFLALLAMLVYQDGIQTIIRFAGIYGAEVGVGQSQQIAAFAMVQLLGVPFAFVFGSLGARHRHQAGHLPGAGDLHGGRHARLLHAERHALLPAGRPGRHGPGRRPGAQPVALLAADPRAKTSEDFGFYAVVERFATILGPLVFTLSGALTGSSRSAVARDDRLLRGRRLAAVAGGRRGRRTGGTGGVTVRRRDPRRLPAPSAAR